MTSSRTASWIFLFETCSACCVDTTTVSMRTGLPSSYWTVTWLLPSGRSQSSDLRRTSASRRVSAWA